MPRFSLICPSRNRTFSLQRLLQSLEFTTTYKQDFELLIIIDNDDTPTRNYLETILNTKQYPNINIKIISRERSDYLNRDYYNYGAQYAQGDFLWAIGDDVEFKVINWDVRIINHLNGFISNKTDKIICAGIRDNTPKPKPSLPMFPCFPLISKEAFKAVGYLLSPNVPTWGADYLIYLLYNGANRYLAIRDDEYLHHIGVHTKSGPKDETAQSIEDRFRKYQFVPENNIDRTAESIIPGEIERLKQYIIQVGGVL